MGKIEEGENENAGEGEKRERQIPTKIMRCGD